MASKTGTNTLWMHRRPALRAVLLAAALTVFVALTDRLFGGEPDLALRLVSVFALVLVTFDAIWVAQATKGPRVWRSRERWRYATTMGWYFFAFMLLATWSGPGPAWPLGPLVAGVFFGLAMGFLRWTDSDSVPFPAERFDPASDRAGEPLLGRLFYAWHGIVAGVIAVQLLWSRGGDGVFFIVAQICLLPWLLQRYAYRRDTAEGQGGRLLFGGGIALLGAAHIVAAFF